MIKQVFCLLFVAAISAEDVFKFRGGKSYVFGTTGKPWLDAETICQGHGGHLITVQNEDEWNFVYAEAQKLEMKHFWIGLNDRQTEGTFTYDHEHSSYRRWSNNEPNNHGGNEDCAQEWNNGYWNDNICENNYPYVCKVNRQIELVNWYGSGQAAAFYYFGKKAKNYADASANCQGLGGELTSVSSEFEWQWIYQQAKVRGMNNFWIGLNDRDKEEEFVWDDGTSYNFRKWSNKEPNNVGGNEDCTQEWNNGFWNDNNCDKKFPYVCKVLSFTQGGKYTIFREAKGWGSARDHCKELGGDLAVVTTPEEDNYLNQQLELRGLNAAWIGASDFQEGDWKLVNGQKVCYTNWCKNEPNNLGQEDCAQIRWHKDGCWNDNKCGNSYPYICEF